MIKYTGSNARVFYTFLAVFLPVTAVMVLLTWYFYSFHILQQEKDRLRSSEKEHIEVHRQLLQASLKELITDIKIVSSNPDLLEFLRFDTDPHDHAVK